MKHVTPFVISEFTNPSGEIVYRVYARIDGQRFRKNFATRAEAEAERQIQEVQWLQGDTGTRAAITRSALKAGTGQRRPNSCDLKSSATW
jgi:aminoglycoside phosphotransferase